MLKGWESGDNNETTDAELLKAFMPAGQTGKVSLTIKSVNETLRAQGKRPLTEEELGEILGDDVWKYNTDALTESEIRRIWSGRKEVDQNVQ